jgi:hypothetical protein
MAHLSRLVITTVSTVTFSINVMNILLEWLNSFIRAGEDSNQMIRAIEIKHGWLESPL